jgi:hypothetical protein
MQLAARGYVWYGCVTLTALLLGGAFNPARAAPLTYSFTGTVDSVDVGLGGTFSVGQALTGSYTFESTTAARAGSNSTFAVFDALTAISFSVGGYSASSSGAPEIQVDNNPGGGNHDRYAIVSRASDGLTGPAVAGNALDSFSFRMDDSTDTVFTDALVLPTSLNFSSFDSTQFFIFFTDPTGSPLIVSGTLGSLTPAATPEPSTLTLLGIGIAGTAGYGWRRRKKAAPAC